MLCFLLPHFTLQSFEPQIRKVLKKEREMCRMFEDLPCCPELIPRQIERVVKSILSQITLYSFTNSEFGVV